MEDILDLRLVKVLRHVLETPITIQALSFSVARSSKISVDTALTYIWELIQDKHLTIDSYNLIRQGPKPIPSELKTGGYYLFRSSCWSCGKVQEKVMNLFIEHISWSCLECSVKWTDKVSDE